MAGGRQQEYDTQDVVAGRRSGETKQEKDSPLEWAPGLQERHRLLKALHLFRLHSVPVGGDNLTAAVDSLTYQVL